MAQNEWNNFFLFCGSSLNFKWASGQIKLFFRFFFSLYVYEEGEEKKFLSKTTLSNCWIRKSLVLNLKLFEARNRNFSYKFLKCFSAFFLFWMNEILLWMPIFSNDEDLFLLDSPNRREKKYGNAKMMRKKKKFRV